MSAQEQMERIRRNQEFGRPLPRPASPRLLALGRTLSPARRQPDTEPRVKGTEGATWGGGVVVGPPCLVQASVFPSVKWAFPSLFSQSWDSRFTPICPCAADGSPRGVQVGEAETSSHHQCFSFRTGVTVQDCGSHFFFFVIMCYQRGKQ